MGRAWASISAFFASHHRLAARPRILLRGLGLEFVPLRPSRVRLGTSYTTTYGEVSTTSGACGAWVAYRSCIPAGSPVVKSVCSRQRCRCRKAKEIEWFAIASGMVDGNQFAFPVPHLRPLGHLSDILTSSPVTVNALDGVTYSPSWKGIFKGMGRDLVSHRLSLRPVHVHATHLSIEGRISPSSKTDSLDRIPAGNSRQEPIPAVQTIPPDEAPPPPVTARSGSWR